MSGKKSKMSPFGRAAHKATGDIAMREHAEWYYKKQADKEKEIPKLVPGKKSGGTVKYKHGGSVDGCAVRGKTKGKMC